MFKKMLIATGLTFALVLPTLTWAKDQCSCMSSSGNMTKCQSAVDGMMMDKLGKKDNQYDKRFIDMMIPHHEAAIMMAKDALKNATHSEIKEMAQQIINAQQKEIEQLKTWRSQWYGQQQKED